MTATATEEFFESLAHRGREPLLDKVNGTVRFDISQDSHTTHYLVTIKSGNIAVSQGQAAADSTVTADRVAFDPIARGETNAFTAFLRGAINVEGNLELLVLIGRLFPGTPGRRV